MMKKYCLASLVLGAAMIVGCKEEPVQPSPYNKPPTPPTAPATMPAEMPDDVKTEPTTGPATLPTASAIGEAARSVTESGDMAKAQELLSQTMKYINENKADLAEKSLTQLEGMKGSLPESMQKQVENARTMLNGLKGKDSLKGLEGVPGLSK